MAGKRQYLDKEGFDRLVENIQEGYQPKGDYLTAKSDNITEIESKLEGVTKAADDSEVIKGIRLRKSGEDEDEVIVPSTKQYPGYVRMEYSDGISISTKTNYGERTILTFSADTDYIATKDDLAQLKTDILGDDLEETFDTLKAVQDWADEHGTEYAELVKEVDKKADKNNSIRYITINNAQTLIPNASRDVKLNFDKNYFTSVGNNSYEATVSVNTDNVALKSELTDAVFGKEIIDETTFPDLNILTREDLKKDLFIDLWKKQVGKYGTYNEETGYFELGTIKDLTYNDALNIWTAGVYHGNTILKGFYMHGTINLDSSIRARANLPKLGGINGSATTMDFTFYANSFIEQVIFQIGVVGPSTFYLCERLRQIGLENSLLYSLNSLNNEESYKNCPKLELIYGALRGGNNINVSWSPLLKLETFKCWLDNCFITSPITIIVHQDVYDKLTDSSNEEWYAVNQQAIEKQITFATV